MRIVADGRERASGVPALLVEQGVDVEPRCLGAGDYSVGGGGVVERKTVRGLHLDLVAGRFWRQFGLVRRHAAMPYLLVEGVRLDDGPLSAAAIRGACLAAADLGVPVLRSSSPADSALWIRLLAAHRQAGARHARAAYAGRPKTPAGPVSAEAALAAVPGI
jgi:ERCC4-type nuclease